MSNASEHFNLVQIPIKSLKINPVILIWYGFVLEVDQLGAIEASVLKSKPCNKTFESIRVKF